ncbi:hypothetical protein IMSAG192_01429 [Muribaculaceae bacterium]|nr:hypothetical protein IMSAG192_01429 [Muribaculaceae bacterium]
MEPLDQSLSIDAHKLNHTAKVINSFHRAVFRNG